MALPSQQQRGGGRGPRLTGGRSRRRRRSKRLLGFVVLVVVVGLLVWQWPSIFSGTPDSAGASDDIASSTDTTPSADTRTDGSNASRLVVDQGRGGSALQPVVIERDPTPNRTNATPEQTGSTEMVMGNGPESATPTRTEPARREPTEVPRSTGTLGVTDAINGAIEAAEMHLSSNRPTDARDVLNRALHEGGISATDADLLRARLSDLADTLTFSPRAYPGDETATTYTVRSGDALSVVPRRADADIDYRLVQRLNRISNPSRIRVGQTLKVLTGPFHAIVDKSAFRLDIYADQTDSEGNRLYIRSLPVGLGEYGTTPVGDWKVRENGRVANPAWVNPRTGEKFDQNDPEIPIGEFWIGLEGTDPETELMEGYGLHGTNEPESIGLEMSMGCVRLLADDIALLYEMISEASTVRIVD